VVGGNGYRVCVDILEQDGHFVENDPKVVEIGFTVRC
jgi:hypothetical protein